MVHKISLSFVILTFVSFIQVNAQNANDLIKIKALYPNSDKVRLNTETKIDIRLVNSEIKIDLYYFEEDYYLNKKANFYSEQSHNYNTFYELKDIKASSFVSQQGKYKEYKVKKFTQIDDLSGKAFYDDHKTVQFLYSNLQEGGKSNLWFQESINNPRFLGPHFFGTVFPIINSNYTIEADKDISLKFIEFNTDSLEINFTKEEKNGKIIYQWNVNDVPQYEEEDNSVSFRYSMPHVIPYITAYKIKDEESNLLNNVSGLYRWYSDLTIDLNKTEPNPDLVKLVDSLTLGNGSEIEKVRSIYYWVQQNIKYVAYEYGLGGFIPREANTVFKNKYGDCKDNSSILQEMLKIASIQSHLTWIGTRDLPYSYNDVPTPASDNHMILTYFDDTTAYFLDATGRFYKLGIPTYFIQGKEALIAIDSSNFIIKRVPIVEAKQNYIIDSVWVDINNKTMTGHGKLIVDGYPKIDLFSFLGKQNTSTDLKEFYNINLLKGNNKFLISDFKEYNKFNYDKEFVLDYRFHVDDYLLYSGDEIFININLLKYFEDYKIEDEDKLDKEYKYKNLNKLIVELNIPEDYQIQYLPKNQTFENNLFTASINYSENGNKIIYQHDIELDLLNVLVADHQEFNLFVENLSKAYKESIVLKKIISN